MLASAINHNLDNYMAWQPVPKALHIDAFTLNCNGMPTCFLLLV